MIPFTEKRTVSIRQFGIINFISALKYSLGKKKWPSEVLQEQEEISVISEVQ